MTYTKNNKGAFRCYEAALPDEPIFTILGRDPAAPATLRQWASDRIRRGKCVTPDDTDRIADARRDARVMEEWRKANLNVGPNGEPAWRFVTINDDDGGPVRSPASEVQYIPAERDGEAIRISREWLLQRVEDLVTGRCSREDTATLLSLACAGIEKPRKSEDWVMQPEEIPAIPERITELEAEVKDLRAATHNWQTHVWHEYSDPECLRPITVTRLSFSRMSELLDYATCYGEFDEETPDGTESQHGNRMCSPMDAERRSAIWTLKRCMGILPEGAQYPEMPEPALRVTVYTEGLFAVPGVKEPQTMQQIAEAYARAGNPAVVVEQDYSGIKGTGPLTQGERIVVDTHPGDLAHAPEVPPHRFSMFHKGERYAYAKGLEINPTHLPVALDAMAVDGWFLIAIFGQTDSKNVGFIFERREREFSAFEMIHGFGGPTRAEIEAQREGKEYRRFMAGEPLDEIRDSQPVDGACTTGLAID